MHAMQEIAQAGMAQVQKEDKPAHAHIHAHAIFAAFAGDNSVEERRLNTVMRMAIGDSRLTSGQLEDEIAAALRMASEADKTAGFKAKDDAKGQDKYGPKRASMNTVSSEIRQVWGAMVHCAITADRTSDGMAREPLVSTKTGFSKAVAVARKALKDHGIKWDGAKVTPKEVKEAAALAHAKVDEEAAYATEFPQQQGETIADFQQRQTVAVELRLLAKQEAARKEAIKVLCDKLVKDHGLEMCVELADVLYARWEDHAAAQQKAD